MFHLVDSVDGSHQRKYRIVSDFKFTHVHLCFFGVFMTLVSSSSKDQCHGKELGTYEGKPIHTSLEWCDGKDLLCI